MKTGIRVGSRAARGMTLIEMVFAVAIGTALVVSTISISIMLQRIVKTTMTQQISAKTAKTIFETLNRELRMAQIGMVVVYDDTGAVVNAPTRGNRIDFARVGEPASKRRIRLLPGADNNYLTPWDNTLVFDPDTSVDGNEIIVATNVSTTNSLGAFSFAGGVNAPINIQLRTGDPALAAADPNLATLTPTIKADSDARTGANQQGVDVNISVAPRCLPPMN